MANPRGRPPSNGKKPAWMLKRAGIIVAAFMEARRAGEKYESALEIAAEAVSKEDPSMKATPSLVKKTLKTFMPEGAEEMLMVSKQIENADGHPDSENTTTRYVFRAAPKPVFPHPSKRKALAD